ncbi:ubiquitinyl hydrolase [Ramaria rubella]|nr:ubiquitinyl hydrolase [Ramaria rubella]
MACPHLAQLAHLASPRLSQSVHREECTQCFDNQDFTRGVDVCLSCFNGGCVNGDSMRNHARLHASKQNHAWSLNVKRKVKPSTLRDDSEPPLKLKKLAIVEERDEDKYEYETTLRCWTCGGGDEGKLLPEESANSDVKRLTVAIMQSMSSARQSEVKAWEEEILACEHTLTLQQLPSTTIPASGLAHCVKCDLKDNLWLCLTCGALGCGRQQFGGIGGNGHGLAHYEETGHPVAVKLGTITPEGNADIYCYTCNDSKLDPELALHLSAFGINIATQIKTEKSVTELQIEQNLKFDFSLTNEDGTALEPLFGPGLTGLSNLGNSCYMASTLQTLFALAPFRERYISTLHDHAQTCTEPLPAACVDCQMRKVADGLLSGRYSVPRSHLPDSSSSSILPPTPSSHDSLQHPAPTPVFQEGIKPTSFKALIGKGHEEFATMRQQDAEEFLAHLLKVLRQQGRRVGGADAGSSSEKDPTDIFKFGVEQRLQCAQCAGVRYRVDEQDDLSVPVPAHEAGKDAEGKVKYADVKLEECLDIVTGAEEITERRERCGAKVSVALHACLSDCARGPGTNAWLDRRTLFKTFPDVLVLHAKRFQLVNWVPTKLDIPLELPADDELVLDKYFGRGLQEGEQSLPDDSASAPAQPTFKEAALEQMQAVGFPPVRCQKALLATGNSRLYASGLTIILHADIDVPLETSAGAGAGAKPEPSAEQTSMLADMGFTTAQARKALKETDGILERAVEWLFSHPDDTGEPDTPSATAENVPPTSHPGGSAALPARYRLKAFISHKCPSVHSGHYVVHIRRADGWVLFNDEKVVKADEESVRALKRLAYLYVFERVE